MYQERMRHSQVAHALLHGAISSNYIHRECAGPVCKKLRHGVKICEFDIMSNSSRLVYTGTSAIRGVTIFANARDNLMC